MNKSCIFWMRKTKNNVAILSKMWLSKWGKGTGCTLGCRLVSKRNRVWSTSWAPLRLERGVELSGWFCLRGVSGIIQSNSAVWSSNICSTRSLFLLFVHCPYTAHSCLLLHWWMFFFFLPHLYLNELFDTLKRVALLLWVMYTTHWCT